VKIKEIKYIITMSLSGYQHKLQVVIEDDTLRSPKNELGFDVPLSGI